MRFLILNKIGLALQFAAMTLLFFLLSQASHGQEQKGLVKSSEFSFSQMSELDPTLAQKLLDAGFDGNPDDLHLSVTESISSDLPGSSEPAVFFKVSENESLPAIKNSPKRGLWAAGVVLSNVYLQGLSATYLHFNPRKNKIIYHASASLSGTPELSNFTLSFDEQIGKLGFYIGLNAQMIRYHTSLINDAPAIYIPGGGIEGGWQRAWGKNKRVYTDVKVGSFVTTT